MRPITVIIPTRNRSDTLYWSLKSCVAQDYERLTILVSDNCSEDSTRDVVQGFNDPRIKYVKTPQPTSKAGNLEFALSQCVDDEGWVTAFGDDDGLVPGSLIHADKLLDEHPQVAALTWPQSNYNWPNCLVDEWKNAISVNVGTHCQVLESSAMLQKLADYTVYYHHLPGLWTSLVPTWALRECRARTGRFSISGIPDAGTAVAMACIIPRYLYAERPVSMLGSSSHSNGISTGLVRTEVINRFYSEETVPPHKDLVRNHTGVYYSTESLLWARDLGILPAGVNISLRHALGCMLIRSHRMGAFEKSFEETVAAVRQMAAMHGITMDFSPREASDPATPVLFRDPVITAHEERITMRCIPTLVSNIYDAVVFACHLIEGRNAGVIRTNLQVAGIKAALKEKLAGVKARNTRLKARIADLEAKKKWPGWLRRLFAKSRGQA